MRLFRAVVVCVLYSAKVYAFSTHSGCMSEQDVRKQMAKISQVIEFIDSESVATSPFDEGDYSPKKLVGLPPRGITRNAKMYAEPLRERIALVRGTLPLVKDEIYKDIDAVILRWKERVISKRQIAKNDWIEAAHKKIYSRFEEIMPTIAQDLDKQKAFGTADVDKYSKKELLNLPKNGWGYCGDFIEVESLSKERSHPLSSLSPTYFAICSSGHENFMRKRMQRGMRRHESKFQKARSELEAGMLGQRDKWNEGVRSFVEEIRGFKDQMRERTSRIAKELEEAQRAELEKEKENASFWSRVYGVMEGIIERFQVRADNDIDKMASAVESRFGDGGGDFQSTKPTEEMVDRYIQDVISPIYEDIDTFGDMAEAIIHSNFSLVDVFYNVMVGSQLWEVEGMVWKERNGNLKKLKKFLGRWQDDQKTALRKWERSGIGEKAYWSTLDKTKPYGKKYNEKQEEYLMMLYERKFREGLLKEFNEEYDEFTRPMWERSEEIRTEFVDSVEKDKEQFFHLADDYLDDSDYSLDRLSSALKRYVLIRLQLVEERLAVFDPERFI